MKKLFLSAILLFALLPIFASASTPTTVTVTSTPTSSGNSFLGLGIPGSRNVETDGPVALIANLYQFMLMIGGLLAFGSIIYGAVMYLANPGSSEAQGAARGRIRDAILGLLLLLGIFFLLNLVDPSLTKLRFPILKTLKPAAPASSSGSGNGAAVIDPTKPAWACVEHGYSAAAVSEDKSKIKMCYATEAACIGDTQGCPSPGTLNDCISVPLGSVCSGTNPILGACPVPDLPAITDSAALQMENGTKQVWVADDPVVQSNLTKLSNAVAALRRAVEAKGGSITVNSAYRPLAYQRHFWEINDRWSKLENSTDPNCSALKNKVSAEKEKHGILGVVSTPSCNSPHVKGSGVDITLNGYRYDDVNKLLEDNNIPLRWQAIPNDYAHFNLQNYEQPSC